MDKPTNNSGKTEIEHLLQQVQPHMPRQDDAALRQQLQQAVAYLIVNDFERLVQLLYKVDVDEKHLKSLLQQQQGKTADSIIATLLIERQLQKAKMRQQYNPPAADTDEERW